MNDEALTDRDGRSLALLCPHGRFLPHKWQGSERYGGRLQQECDGGRLLSLSEAAPWILDAMEGAGVARDD